MNDNLSINARIRTNAYLTHSLMSISSRLAEMMV